jgi:hypothetical protein
MAAGDMGFSCHPISSLKVRHILPNFEDLAGIFVAKEKRELDP